MLRRPIHAIEELVRLSYLKDHALADIYLSEAIKMFGVSLVSIFETIYLFVVFKNLGVAFPAAAVFGFFSVFFIAFALLCPLGALFSSCVCFFCLNIRGLLRWRLLQLPSEHRFFGRGFIFYLLPQHLHKTGVR